MRKSTTTLCAMALVVLLFVSAPGGGHSEAQTDGALPPMTVFGFRQVPLVSGGQPVEAILDCSCVTPHDRILVYAPNKDMRASRDWRIGTNDTDDIWIIDIGARGRASLIIKFRTDKDSQTALLYDDVTGDGSVAYHVTGGQVIVGESPYWTLSVQARPRWRLADGRINLNVSSLMDGPSPNSFQSIDESQAAALMHHDGAPDISFDLVQDQKSDIATYALARLLDRVPKQSGVGQSHLWVNVGKYVSQSPQAVLSWPFLSFRPPQNQSPQDARLFKTLPQVTMDWKRAVIQGFTLPGYPMDDGWLLNNTSPILLGTTNDVSFEAPHAWYDLANDPASAPDLNIRLSYNQGTPWQEIRYSWKQSTAPELIWDYKVGMMGAVPITSTVAFPNFKLRMIPYERLPYWSTNKSWDLTTFVAREGASNLSSEGIYYWSPWSGPNPLSPKNPSAEVYNTSAAYLNGASTKLPAGYFSSIPVGYRGEYNLTRPIRPVLYFSPVDRRLHLKGARYGLLNMGSGHTVTYNVSNGGQYLDEWSDRQGAVIQSLYKAGDYLIYGGASELLIKRTGEQDAKFETLPPRNHAEWVSLGSKLQQGDKPMSPDNLLAMVGPVTTSTLRIPGAKLISYRRLNGADFRFVFSITTRTQVQGGHMAPDEMLAPGRYVATFSRQLSFRSLTAASLSANVQSTSLTQSYPGEVEVILTNDGLQDVPRETLEISATGPSLSTRRIASLTVAVLAGVPTIAAIHWTPLLAGTWTLTPRLRGPGTHTATFPSTTLTVLPVSVRSPSVLLNATSMPSSLGILGVGLLALALLGGSILWWQLRIVDER